ncbi:hypothetical protein QYE76_055183 [Lolium multiflorum]|uniref:Uncharacterized protein n=1 Tax=Lolium multiflorum TaxID=4521 RepID=A0AAD8SZS3_LOLMU|nr:hypothetical protein QYE76_055183 [Lolium multiflorum]
MVSYLLASLHDPEYNFLVAATLAGTEPITLSELYSQLLSYESRRQMVRGSGSSHSSVNTAISGGGRSRFHYNM